MAKGHKKPTTGGLAPSAQKTPKAAPFQIEGGPLAWRFSACDVDGPFSWAALTSEKHLEVLGKLKEFELKSWEEIKRGGSHPIKTSECCREARDRLEQLERDDIDESVSLRLTGTERVWCTQTANIMNVLWWDPDHKVFPTLKDKADRIKEKQKRK